MALAEWRQAGRDEALFSPTWDTWDVWWSDYALGPTASATSIIVGAYADFDDHVLVCSDVEGVGESDEWSGGDDSDFADSALV